MLTRLHAVAALVVVMVGTTGAVLATEPTSAAWVDSVFVRATATTGTWDVPGCVVTDSAGTPVTGGPTCQVAFGPDTDASATVWNIKTTVSTTSATAVHWKLTVDFAANPFPFVAKYVSEYSGTAVPAPLAAGFCSGSTRMVTFTGRADWGRATISATQSVVLDFVGSGTNPGGAPIYSCP